MQRDGLLDVKISKAHALRTEDELQTDILDDRGRNWSTYGIKP